MNDRNMLQELSGSPIWNRGVTENIYRFPLPIDRDFLVVGTKIAVGIPRGNLYRLGPYYADRSPESHVSPYKWAVDFLVPDGTEIFAAECGEIIDVVENFNVWGNSEDFADKVNYLTILHNNSEYSQYCHLEQDSVTEAGLKVGDYVERGQLIGCVGKTGWTDRDHLHFMVFRLGRLSGSLWGFYSLKPQFEPVAENMLGSSKGILNRIKKIFH